MKINKKKLFKLHSWIGIKISILFFVVCFSGTVATLSSEIDWLVMPDIRATPKSTYASTNLAVNNIKEVYPDGEIVFYSAAVAPYLCNIVFVQDQGKLWYVFVNPYTGSVQGATTLTVQRFFRDIHYYLYIPFAGHYIVLIFAFLLLLSLTTAVLFYKQWWKKLFDLKTGNGKLVFYRSLHRLVGAWSVPFMLLFSITGIWYFVERLNIGGVGSTSNPSAPTLEVALQDTTNFKHISTNLDYDRAIAMAQQEIPGLKIKDISPPSDMNRPIYLNGISEVPLVRNRANRVYVHPETYEVIKVQKAEDIGTTMFLNDIADPLHFGYWGGLVTKIIWFFGGLGISGLVLTGLWIGYKRNVRNKQKQKAQRMGKWKYVNWVFWWLIVFFIYGTLVVRYHATLTAFLIISSFLVLCIFGWWYLFSYQLKKSLKKELTRA